MLNLAKTYTRAFIKPLGEGGFSSNRETRNFAGEGERVYWAMGIITSNNFDHLTVFLC